MKLLRRCDCAQPGLVRKLRPISIAFCIKTMGLADTLKHSGSTGWLFEQSGELSVLVITAALGLVMILSIGLLLSRFEAGAGVGNKRSIWQRIFSFYSLLGRLWNLLVSPINRCRGRYPVSATCQVPFFKSLSEIYVHALGYRENGTFVEIGAYDGESFSNTSGLADIGWTGHYIEPIPAYAEACRRRHVANRSVNVHNICVGERDGEDVELSAAGPFSSAVPDEVDSVTKSNLGGLLEAMGWGHGAATATKVKTRSVALNTFFRQQKLAPGHVDVMVLDVEGFEWPIIRGFDLAHFKPKLVIVELQQHLRRFANSPRAQEDALSIEASFARAGYSIMYRDVINTVFIHRDVKVQGGD